MRAEGCLDKRGEDGWEAGDEDREALEEDMCFLTLEVERRPLAGGRSGSGLRESP